MLSTAHCSFSTYKRATCLLKLYTENLTPWNHRTTLKGKPRKNEQPPLKGLTDSTPEGSTRPTARKRNKSHLIQNPTIYSGSTFKNRRREIKISMKAKVLETEKGKKRNLPHLPCLSTPFPLAHLIQGRGNTGRHKRA